MGTTARSWLKANGYDDVVVLIDEVIAQWKREGKATRRNWWDILAGGPSGERLTVAGRTFPVLRVAQLRQGRPVTKSALRRKKREKPPPVWKTRRWSAGSG